MTTPSSNLLPYPRGIMRHLLHGPVLLYRMGLGSLLDLFHIMILTTRGRRSGQARYTPIEYRRHGSKYYVISAWGARPNWYQNLQADSCVTIAKGGRSFAARGEIVESNAEALLVLHLFRRPNPIVYDAILARLGNVETLDPKRMPDVAHQYTIVRFNPTSGEMSLPSPGDDLRWTLPVAGALTVLGFLVVLLARTRKSPGDAQAHE